MVISIMYFVTALFMLAAHFTQMHSLKKYPGMKKERKNSTTVTVVYTASLVYRSIMDMI
jgi:hypothetical protein